MVLTQVQVGGHNNYIHPRIFHPIIGIAVLFLLFLLPATQVANHYLYPKYGEKIKWVSYVHIWLGRFVLLVAIVNGGLGFKFADQLPKQGWSNAPRIAYGVIAVVVIFLYVVVAVMSVRARRKKNMAQASDRVREEEMQGLRLQPVGNGYTTTNAGDETRPQTAQTAQTTQTDSTTGGAFKSHAL